MSRRSARLRGSAASVEVPITPEPIAPKRELDELDLALLNREECLKEKAKLPTLQDLQKIKKDFKRVCDDTKRHTQELNQKLKKPMGRTRSKSKSGPLNSKQDVSSDGKWINKGIDDAKESFAADELEYLEKTTGKIREVNKLKLEHIKYLVIDVFLKELRDIRDGKIESSFHTRYHECSGMAKSSLSCDIRTSLFTNQQRDYINGLLQGAFDTTNKDDSGDIKHSDINYVGLVMLAEVTIRIVRYVHKFKSNEQAYEFMSTKSREALGLEDSD